MEKEKVVFEGNDGSKTELKIFMSYHSEKFNKNYVVFYQDEKSDDLLAGVIDSNGDVHDVESEEEYKELDQVIEEYQIELEKKEKEAK